MNKKQGLKNIIFSFFSQILILLFGFLVPRIILKNYGSDTNGVINTITQIFTYLSLLEAGISQATSNSLYKHLNIKKRDEKNICEIMSVSQNYFKKVSYIYGAGIFIIALIIPLLLKTSISYNTLSLYIIFEGLTSLISFYYIQLWNALLLVDGKNYIVNFIDLLYKVICYIIKIILAINGVSIIYAQIGCFVISLIRLFVYKKIIIKKYNWVKLNKNIDPEKKLENKSAYLISEIAWTIFSSTDMIILSIFCSTQAASIYSVYNMVFLALNSLLNSVYNSVKYILGQKYFEDKKIYEVYHDTFNSIFMGIITVMMCISFVLIIPFVKLYTKGIDDINYIYDSLPILFCLVQLLSWSRYVSGNLTAIAGFAKNTSYISIVESIINIILSIILVNKYGMTGVLVATVCALPLKVLYCNYLSDKVILKRKATKTISILGINWIVFILTVIVFNEQVLEIKNIFEFLCVGLILGGIYTVIVLFSNILINESLRKIIFKICKKEKIND